MRVNQVNLTVSEQKRSSRNNKERTVQDSRCNSPDNQVSFKGGVDTFCLGIANAIENGGLAVSFTLQDMLGTNLPRPLMGLMRNSKENKGEKNKKFAAKELVREMMTGPSMFIIPMIMLGIGKNLFGKAIDVPMKAIKSLGQVHADAPLNEAGKAIGKQDFYKNTFTEIIKNAKSEKTASEETIKTAVEFAGKLSAAGDKKQLKNTTAELGSQFVEIAKSHAKNPAQTDFTQAVVKDSKSSFKKTVSNMVMYADDIVEKTAKNAENATSDIVNKAVNKSIFKRLAANVLMYAAVLAFLQVIPKLYNRAEGEKNAGLKGLMKEETFNDKSFDAEGNNDEKNVKNNDYKGAEKDMSKPSFGSSAGFANALTNDGITGKIANGIEFDGCNVSFPLLLGIMGFGIILPRILNAKDDYDKEEIIRRDVITCFTMCFAEKALRKCFSKYNESRSGFVLSNKPQGFQEQSTPKKIFDYLRPVKGVNVLNSEQILAKYSDIDKYKDGVKGFCNFVSGQGGNLSKVFGLTDESKSLVQGMLGEGKNIANATNAEITDAITKAEGTEALGKLADLFKLKDKKANTPMEKFFKLGGKTNPWVEKAKTYNARFTALSVMVIVPAFLGFFLPWLNEKSTKKRISKEMAEKDKIRNNTFNNIQKNRPKVFEDMTVFSSKS